jgi:predicted nucleotidyltransferase
MSSELQKNILATLAYYDAMDYPLTAFEVCRYLLNFSQSAEEDGNQAYSLADVIGELENEKLKKFIEEFNGFYFLNGRRDLVAARLFKNKVAEQKLRLAVKLARILRLAPYVRMVAVTGSLAMKNTDPDSDLDFLVVLKHGKIWTGRFLVTALTQLIGRRRHGNKIKNRACLNYFITTRTLEISLKDVFSASEYSFIFPLYGLKTFHKFQKHNQWIKKYKLNFRGDSAANLKLLKDDHFSKAFRKAGETIFQPAFIETLLGNWQRKKIANNPKTGRPGSLIVATDEMLIFLPEPQGPQIYELFQKKLDSLSRS